MPIPLSSTAPASDSTATRETPAEQSGSVYYQPPEQHAAAIRRFARLMAVAFTCLFAACTAFVWYADRILVLLPFSAEKQFFRPYEAMAKKYWLTGDGSPQQRYLQKLADSLAGDMALPADITLSVHYVDHSMVNAFATLGGNILVFRGMLEQLPDENSLAMVLAHEIAHIKNRDPVVGLGRGLVLQVIYGYLTGHYGSGDDVVLRGGEAGMMYFSRDQEQRADTMALEALQRHYGHVAGATRLFETLRACEKATDKACEEDAQQSTLWASHPGLEQRMAHLQAYSLQNNWLEGEITPYPKLLKPEQGASELRLP